MLLGWKKFKIRIHIHCTIICMLKSFYLPTQQTNLTYNAMQRNK